jgi:CDGSH-type Zn-finger protein
MRRTARFIQPFTTLSQVRFSSGTKSHYSVSTMSEVQIHRKPRIAQQSPFKTDVKAGETYWWCACGHSKNQPFCDGSHEAVNKKFGTNFSPIEWKATENKTVWFCGCKRSKKAPFCDGTHAKLSPQEVAENTGPAISDQK